MDSYTRYNRKFTHYERYYQPIDSINFEHITLCKNEKIESENKLKTNSKISFSNKSIKKGIQKSLSSHFNYVDDFKNENINWNQNCQYLNKEKKLSKNQKYDISNQQKYSLKLTFDIEYISRKNFDTDASYSINSYHIKDNDRHFLKYLLIIGIFENENLIYMDNQVHWTEVFSERNEQMIFEIPEIVTDSMVNLSLKEYYNRLE